VLFELGATAPKLAAGEFRAVRITGQSGYDLLAAPA